VFGSLSSLGAFLFFDFIMISTTTNHQHHLSVYPLPFQVMDKKHRE
jgi:hypothetical protein